MGYTWRQFTDYRDQAQRRRARDQRDQLVLLRSAFATGTAASDLYRALHADAGVAR